MEGHRNFTGHSPEALRFEERSGFGGKVREGLHLPLSLINAGINWLTLGPRDYVDTCLLITTPVKAHSDYSFGSQYCHFSLTSANFLKNGMAPGPKIVSSGMPSPVNLVVM